MAETPLYPLTFEPILKSLIWGGRRLGALLGKPIGDEPRCAESWEISDHRDDVSRVNAGVLAGASLRDLARDRGREIFGAKGEPGGQFPLLLKFLDANDVLSVQVHPDDALGQKLAGDNGKTEAWVIVHAEPGSLIYAGLRPGVTREDFSTALAAGLIEPLLHRFPAREGDCIMIPAGTVHAIGAGVVLAEIQQMSDATFRVHDWGRVGPDGKPRQLHVAEALEATDFNAGPVNPIEPLVEPLPGTAGTRERLAACDYFALERLRLASPWRIGQDDRFTIVACLGGRAEVRGRGGSVSLRLGETALLPASVGACDVVPSDEAVLLTCVVP